MADPTQNPNAKPPADDAATLAKKVEEAAKRRKSVTLAVLVVVAAVLFALVYIGKSHRTTAASVVQTPVLTHPTTVGFKATPSYAAQVREQNAQGAASAQKSGATYVPAPVSIAPQIAALDRVAPQASLTGLVPVNSLPPAPAGPSALPAAGPSPAYQQAVGYNEQNQQSTQTMVTALQNLATTLTPVAQHTDVFVATPTPNTTGAPTASTQVAAAKYSPVKPGDLFYAVMDTALDSDSPGPAMATIVAGTLKNSKVLGGFTRENEELVVKLDTLVTPQGEVYKINGYVVDPNTSTAAVETSVNNHYLSRWGGLLAGSFLAGYGQAIAQSGTTTQTVIGPGGTTTLTSNPNLSTNAQLKIAAGQTAQQFTSIAQNNFQRPPTVQLAQGTGVGILIVGSGQ